MTQSDMDIKPHLEMDRPDSSPPKPDPRDKKTFYFADTSQRRALISFARMLFKPIMKYEVGGIENYPAAGPVILAANHVTNFDVFPMQFSVPRPIFFMAKAELFKNPIIDVLVRNLSGFPVNRGEKDLWAMDHALKILRHGQTLGMFPEGKRSKGGGLNVAKTGTAKLAIEAGCPILPMTIIGTDKFFKKIPRRAHVHIKILPQILPLDGESPLALTDRLMFTLAQALPQEMRGVYSETPEGFKT